MKKRAIFILVSLIFSVSFIIGCGGKEPLDLSNIVFESQSFIYDGEAHSIYIQGDLPEGVTVTYEGNGNTEIGEYEVYAYFSDSTGKYETEEYLSAYMYIDYKSIHDLNITFKDKEVVYNGEPQQILIEGELPYSGYVEYENNEHTKPGRYEAKAYVHYGFYRIEHTAYLTIKPAPAPTDIVFEDQTFVYDGKKHTMEITSGIPEGFTVSYSNNVNTDAGEYEVKAYVSDPNGNYETATLTATMTIQKAPITGITLEGATFTYDGKAHGIIIQGDLPSGVEVEYENNDQINAGTYKVKAIFIGRYTSNYDVDALVLEADLVIEKAEYNGIVFEDKAFKYDGEAHSLEVTGLPEGVTPIYTNNNQSAAGKHKVVVTFDDTTGNYILPESLEAELFIVDSSYAYIGDEFYFSTDSMNEGEIKVTGYKGSNPVVEIPYTVFYKNKIYNVADIRIAYHDGIEKIILPEGITTTGTYEYSKNLKTIVLSSTVTTISDLAFFCCEGLQSVEFNDNLTTIGKQAFYSCSSLKNITIPACVKEIKDEAFNWCQALESVTFNEGLEKIGNILFGDCNVLEKVVFPEGITTLPSGTFGRTYNLKEVVLPQSLEKIEEYAFSDARKLTSVVIPSGVTEIEENAFYNCVKLYDIYNLSGVEITGLNNIHGSNVTFSGTIHTSLDSTPKVFEVDDFRFVEVNGAYVMLGYYGNEKEVVTPENVNGQSYSVSARAFEYTTLKSVEFSSGVTQLGKELFFLSKYIEKVVFGENIQTITKNSFYLTYTLTDVEIKGNSLTKIEEQAFYSCNNLKTVKFPSSLRVIEKMAFYQCETIEEVILPVGFSTLGSSAFSECEGIKYISIPGTVGTISNYAFKNCINAEMIVFHKYVNENNVTYYTINIGDGAFSNCTKANLCMDYSKNYLKISSIGNKSFINKTALYYETSWYFDENGKAVLK